jgi:hypothetical protein
LFLLQERHFAFHDLTSITIGEAVEIRCGRSQDGTALATLVGNTALAASPSAP